MKKRNVTILAILLAFNSLVACTPNLKSASAATGNALEATQGPSTESTEAEAKPAIKIVEEDYEDAAIEAYDFATYPADSKHYISKEHPRYYPNYNIRTTSSDVDQFFDAYLDYDLPTNVLAENAKSVTFLGALFVSGDYENCIIDSENIDDTDIEHNADEKAFCAITFDYEKMKNANFKITSRNNRCHCGLLDNDYNAIFSDTPSIEDKEFAFRGFDEAGYYVIVEYKDGTVRCKYYTFTSLRYDSNGKITDDIAQAKDVVLGLYTEKDLLLKSRAAMGNDCDTICYGDTIKVDFRNKSMSVDQPWSDFSEKEVREYSLKVPNYDICYEIDVECADEYSLAAAYVYPLFFIEKFYGKKLGDVFEDPHDFGDTAWIDEYTIKAIN